METSLKTGFAQIFSSCPKNLSCPQFGGAAAPLAPPARTPMTTLQQNEKTIRERKIHVNAKREFVRRVIVVYCLFSLRNK